MPALENPKHEEFAQLLARGVKQGDAYERSGYKAGNKAAASRLAKSLAVSDRVEEIKKEVHQHIVTAMERPNEDNFQTLADMGLTMSWVAQQYQHIYEQSVAAGSFSAANTAVNSIQKLIEMETNGGQEKAQDDSPKISVKDTLSMLKEMKEIVREAPGSDIQSISVQEGNDERSDH